MLQHVLPCLATVVGENCSITGCSCACFCDFWWFLVRSLGGFCCACGLFLLQCLFLWLWLPLVPVSVPVVATGSCSCSCSCACWCFCSCSISLTLGLSLLLVCHEFAWWYLACRFAMSLLHPLCLLNSVFWKIAILASFDVWIAVCFGCPWWMPTVLGTAWFSSSDFVAIL